MNASIRRFALPLLLAAASVVATLAPASARAAGDSRLRLELLVNGRTLAEYWHGDTTYVEASRGREYSLRVTNLEPNRVAVAISVDGRNVIDARHTTASDARKWILEPWQSLVLDGWQVSGSRAKHFFFTTEERSYAEWLGDSSNAGVVEAIAFRERQPSWWSSYRPRVSERHAPANEPMAQGRSDRSQAGASPSMPPSMPSRQSPPSAGVKAEREGKMNRDAAPESLASSDAAATGIGRDVGHEIVTVQFQHESRPSASARLRYGFREELVELGVLPRPRPVNPWNRREVARGFEPGPFCPSP